MFFSGFGTIFNKKIKLTIESNVINQKIPSKPIDSPKIVAIAKAEAKAIPILIPIAALALVLTSGLVKSAIRAKIVDYWTLSVWSCCEMHQESRACVFIAFVVK